MPSHSLATCPLPTRRFDLTRWLVVFVGILAVVPGQVSAERRPNVVFILTDDHGALDAGCYGSEDLRTPNIDKVARRGVRFQNAYAHTVCCPARAMLMTGRHPQRGDVGNWTQSDSTPEVRGRNLLLSERTIAEAFLDAGYRTACFGKWHLGAAHSHGPTRQGFEEFFGIRGGFIDNYNHHSLHGQGRHDLYEGIEEQFRNGEYFMDMVTERSVQWMRSHADEPFFLYYPLNLPHYPEQSIAPFESAFADLPEPRRSYAKILATTDHYIGRLIDELDSLGLRDDTLVIITGDNGYSAEDYQISVDDHASGLPKGLNYGANGGGGNTGKWRGAKGSFLEGGLRVPAIISYPRAIAQGETSDAIVTLMDWFPTAADFADIEVSSIEFDGRSTRRFCDSSSFSDASNSPGSSAATDDHYETMNWGWQNGWAARRGDWKLIHNGVLGLNGSGKNASNNRMPKRFLANLADEHPEQKNYAEEKPNLVRELTAQHEAWLQSTQPNEAERWQQ